MLGLSFPWLKSRDCRPISFNDNNNTYTPVAKLSNEDAYNLKELIYDDDDFDYTVATVNINN